MKKLYKILITCIALLIIIIFVLGKKKAEYKFALDEECNPYIWLSTDEEIINGWEKDDIIHFFIPSYVKADRIRTDNEITLFSDGNPFKTIVYNTPLFLTVKNDAGDTIFEHQVSFDHSQKVYTMYIDLHDAVKDDISKKEYTFADMKLFTADGKLEYSNDNIGIHGRGNSTWRVEKKAYSIKLPNQAALCGMNPAKKWNLLANVAEGTKLLNKMLYDFASATGMGYNTASDWVDLFINGEYIGNYQLCEKIEVDEKRLNITDLEAENESLYQINDDMKSGDDLLKGFKVSSNPENISGGYIIEKDVYGYYKKEPIGFMTDSDNCFTIAYPNNASLEEVSYIHDFVQNIDNMLLEHNQEVSKYIDVDSFTKRYFVEELGLNSDAYSTSCYFYKRANEDKLYAGPVWDYDGTFGESNGAWMNYNETVLHQLDLWDGEAEILNWENELHDMDWYQEALCNTYQKTIYPLLKELLSKKIDAYADQVRESVTIDSIRWDYGKWTAGHYSNFDTNIRYLKFFVTQRINLMNQMYGVDEQIDFESTGETHIVYCVYEDQVYEFPVADGGTFYEADLPLYDNNKYSGWKYQRDGLFFCEYLPILETILLVPNERG